MRCALVWLLLTACGAGSVGESAPTETVAPVTLAVTPTVEPIAGTWTVLGHFGDAHHPPRRVRAWVPEHAEGSRLGVVVLVDGSGAEAFFGLPDTLAQLIGEEQIEPYVLLAIDSTEARDDELGRDDTRFVDFVADTLLLEARARLPITSERERTAIAGYSYGGLQAAVAVIRRPEIFGRGILQSASLWVNERALIERFARRGGALPERLWIDVGTSEPDPEQLVRYMVRDARALRDAATARGMVLGRDLGYFEAVGQTHDMHVAASRMREALLFGLGTRDLNAEVPVHLEVARHEAVGGHSAFSITLRHEHGEVLTLPARLTEVFSAGAPVRGEIASTHHALVVRARGLEARCE